MKKIFVKYKWLLIALLMISIIAIPMVVNILFKFSSAFPAEWSAGDALSYVSGLQALLGTIILGIITVEQGQDAQEVNRRLSEENNRLQKIMSQKLLPAVKLTNPSCKPTMLHRGALSYVPQSKQFRIIRSYYGDSVQHETSEIRVNIDSLVEEIKYIKTIEFTSVFHCMTRLRMTVKDVKKVDQKAINDLDGVLGVTYQGGQLQVIIGKDLLKVYEEVLKLGYSDGGAVDEKLDGDLKGEKISVGQAVIGYISAAVQPMVPALIGGGMIKVFLLLISKVYAPFADSSTYTLLSIVGNAVFYFMPILVAYGAAKKLGATPTYSMVVAGALVAPEWTAIVSAGDPVTMFGINVALKGYGSSLLPALLLAIVAYYVEKFLNKVIPGVFKPIFVGTLTMAATYAVSILALAPLGQLAGTYVTAAILWLYNIAGPITVALFTALFPYMVMTGMHMTLGAPMIQLLSETGFDPLFRPGMLLSNMAEGGASLGIAIKAKDKAIKSEALSVAVGCIFASVTEPAIYGFNLPLKKPMWAVSLGGAIGGVVAALLGAHNYEYGSSSLFALPIFEDTIVAMVIAIIVTIVASCVLTILFGFDEEILKKH